MVKRKEPDKDLCVLGVVGASERELSRYKSPEVGMSLVCWKKSRKARVAEWSMCAREQLETQAQVGE